MWTSLHSLCLRLLLLCKGNLLIGSLGHARTATSSRYSIVLASAGFTPGPWVNKQSLIPLHPRLEEQTTEDYSRKKVLSFVWSTEIMKCHTSNIPRGSTSWCTRPIFVALSALMFLPVSIMSDAPGRPTYTHTCTCMQQVGCRYCELISPQVRLLTLIYSSVA